MLVLTRKPGEKVFLINRQDGSVIGTITLVESFGVKSRLGFEFPSEIEILREELMPPKSLAAHGAVTGEA